MDNLYKLYILLGCAVRLKTQPNDDIDLVLAAVWLQAQSHAASAGHRGSEACQPDRGRGEHHPVGPRRGGARPASPLGRCRTCIHRPCCNRFWDAASTLVPHAIAIVIADLMRRRALNKGSWFVASGHRQRGSGANYIRVAVVCGVAGYVGLVLWGLTQGPPTRDSFKIEIPSALLAMVTGGFYVYHLDNAEIGQRPSRAWELCSQSVLTGLCGLIAACATWQIILGVRRRGGGQDHSHHRDQCGGRIRARLVYPASCRRGRFDPLADASQERVRALETAAQARLGGSAPTGSISRIPSSAALRRASRPPPTLTASSALLTCCKVRGP